MGATEKLHQAIQELNLEDEATQRLDCVECGKRNTLTVTRIDGKILWNCYSASCSIGGVTDAEYSRKDVTNKVHLVPKEKDNKPFVVPEYFVRDVTRSSDCLNYIKEFNFMSVYDKNPERFMYDVKGDRLAFMTVHDGVVVGAVGRALKYGIKWYRYDNCHTPFIIQGGDSIAVVVEDCTSACVVSNVGTGIALLGTNLLTEHIQYIKPYKNLVVALDRDATDKAIDIQRKLAIHVENCRVLILERDLKYENETSIKNLLGEMM